ncbi:hypothetical protein HY488_02380 [Candidatus Woesearchaeota archaeon]|nr:hypothetical protein [Candidatus Woesearchaeota archaeon]
MYGKRGQVTIFIIVGIILMFSVALFLYFRNISIPLAELEAVPTEYTPVQNYVQACVDILARRGIVLLGLQGGYLDLPRKVATNPDSYLSIVPNGEIKLPYWYYNGEARVPSQKNMETDIGNYVSLNMLNCLQNFTSLSRQFSITPLGDITSLAIVGEDDVTVQTMYPLSVSLHGRDETVMLTKFATHVPVRLRRMHQLAMDILRAENQGLFLENITIDLMALGSGDPPDGIPFSDMVFACGKLKWHKPRVQESIKNRLFYNLPRITFANTLFDSPPDLYSANNLHIKATEEEYDDLRAGVYYSKDWNFLMNVRPSRDSVMSSDFGKGNEKYLSYICVNIYHFTYDIEYPVRITIRDEAAFDGNGYDFSFATPVMINHNEGNRANPGFSVFETPEGNDQGYCEQVEDKETVIYTKDAVTFEDLRDINVTFNCVDTFRCPLGQTKPDGQVYRLRARLPTFCTPGALEAEGTGYIKNVQDVTNMLATTIFLTPKGTFNLEVMKRPLVNDALVAPRPLEEGETAFVYVTTDAFTDFTQYKKLPLDAESLPEDSMLDLAVGDVTYHLDLLIVDKENNLIGGYRGNWTPDKYAFEGSNTVTLYALEKMPHPIGSEAQAILFMQLENATWQERLRPLFR